MHITIFDYQSQLATALGERESFKAWQQSIESDRTALQQQLAAALEARDNALHREEVANFQLQHMIASGGLMSKEQEVQSMRDVCSVAEHIKTGQNVPVSHDTEDYLQLQGLGADSSANKPGTLEAAQRAAIAAIAAVDTSGGGLLRKWAIMGDSGASKLQRLEQRMQRLEASETTRGPHVPPYSPNTPSLSTGYRGANAAAATTSSSSSSSHTPAANRSRSPQPFTPTSSSSSSSVAGGSGVNFVDKKLSSRKPASSMGFMSKSPGGAHRRTPAAGTKA